MTVLTNISSKFTSEFDLHINSQVSKANKVLSLIRLDGSTFNKLYKALVRPHLEYGQTVWFPHLSRQSKLIEDSILQISKSEITRGHEKKLAKETFRTDIRKYSFSQRLRPTKF